MAEVQAVRWLPEVRLQPERARTFYPYSAHSLPLMLHHTEY